MGLGEHGARGECGSGQVPVEMGATPSWANPGLKTVRPGVLFWHMDGVAKAWGLRVWSSGHREGNVVASKM